MEQLSTSASPTESSRVLIVDDNLDLAESTSIIFKLMGHETAVASSGKAALERIPGFSPNLMLLDLEMPGMSGLEVARTVRGLDRGSQVMLAAHTAKGDHTTELACVDAGFDYYLLKPVDVTTFQQLIRRVRWNHEINRFKALVAEFKSAAYSLNLKQLTFCSLIVDSLAATPNQSGIQQKIIRLDHVLGLIERWLLTDVSVAPPLKLRMKLDMSELRVRMAPFRN